MGFDILALVAIVLLAPFALYGASAYSSSGLLSMLDVMAASLACRCPGRNRQPAPVPGIR